MRVLSNICCMLACRGGSDYFLELAGAVAQCLFMAARTHNSGLASSILAAMCNPSGCLAAVKPLLGPYMQTLLEQVRKIRGVGCFTNYKQGYLTKSLSCGFG